MPVVMGGTVYCPLCEKPMTTRNVMLHNKRATVYLCQPCEIGIFDFDPAFNKWRDADKNIPCPNCENQKMKWFIRFMDGFFKARCPKCGVTLKKDGDVKIQKNGSLYIPGEMDQEEIEEPVELRIPYAHIMKNWGKDKVNELKNKRRKKG